jgi:putative transposase
VCSVRNPTRATSTARRKSYAAPAGSSPAAKALTGVPVSRRRSAGKKANHARNKVHHRVANLREDTLHKMTTRLASEYGTVVVEDLNIAAMGRNRRLSRRIADAAFGEIRRQLTYKTRRHGTRLVVADRWFPSSKTCSRCGVVKAKLPLSVRVFECDNCGLVLDRDANAGHNLAAFAARTTGTGVAGDLDNAVEAESKPRGANRKTRTTRPRRKAGTGRAGGATLPRPRAGEKEAGDRHQDTGAQLAFW